MMTYTDNTETETAEPETIPAWTDSERLQAFLLILSGLLKAGVKLRVRAEFFPASEDQKSALRNKMREFIQLFPDA
jgi:hypothetical protein